MHLYKEIIRKLIRDGITISTAESCTGGLLSYTITKNKNSSKIFKGGYITYSNELKIRDLNIKRIDLKKYGAVSEEIAREMVRGLFIKTKTNICISTTGIAGPGGGTKTKPVGLVFIGIKVNRKIKILRNNFKGSRIEIQKNCVNSVFEYLSKLV